MSKVVRLAGLEPATYGLEGCCSIQLSYKRMILALGGAPEGSRTPNPQIRSLVLYPIELRTLTIQIKKRQYKFGKTLIFMRWGGRWELNPRPSGPQSDALTD